MLSRTGRPRVFYAARRWQADQKPLRQPERQASGSRPWPHRMQAADRVNVIILVDRCN
jgi:hypothetical protein